jgi:hypothetical protein
MDDMGKKNSIKAVAVTPFNTKQIGGNYAPAFRWACRCASHQDTADGKRVLSARLRAGTHEERERFGALRSWGFKAQMFIKALPLIRITKVEVNYFCPNFLKPLLSASAGFKAGSFKF